MGAEVFWCGTGPGVQEGVTTGVPQLFELFSPSVDLRQRVVVEFFLGEFISRECILATEPCGRGEVVFVFNEGSTRDTNQPGRAAREPSDHAGGTRGCGRKEGRREPGKSRLSFSLGFCVNDCGWRLSPVK